MRTTLNLDADVLHAVKSLARSRETSMGAVVSELVRRALRPAPVAEAPDDDFPTFSVPPDAPPLTMEVVQAALEDD